MFLSDKTLGSVLLSVLECRLSCFSFVHDSQVLSLNLLQGTLTIRQPQQKGLAEFFSQYMNGSIEYETWSWSQLLAVFLPAPGFWILCATLPSQGAAVPLAEKFCVRSCCTSQVLCPSLTRQLLIGFCENCRTSQWQGWNEDEAHQESCELRGKTNVSSSSVIISSIA